MSSRLIPPKAGAIHLTAWISSSGSLVSMVTGKASTPPRYLNRIALPSMTGRAASGPMSPSPKTRVPSETTATKFPLFVYSKTFSGESAISRQGWATPGVYQTPKSW